MEAKVLAQRGGKDAAAQSKHEGGGNARFDGFVVPPPLWCRLMPRGRRASLQNEISIKNDKRSA